MILSDRCRFIFVHIPKCAGTSVRRALDRYHDGDPRFVECVTDHPVHGLVDYTHLPLNLLADIAPDVLKRFDTHESFALLRDPAQRFQSAMAQRAKMYLGKEVAQFGDAEFRREVEQVVSHLERTGQVTSPEYIHFARQSDFVFLDGVRIVRQLYPVERMDAFAAAVGRHVGDATIGFGHDNKTTVFRNKTVKRAALAGSGLAKRLLPAPLHERMRKGARRILMAPKKGALSAVFDEPEVKAFLRSYYADDFELHARALAAVTPTGAA